MGVTAVVYWTVLVTLDRPWVEGDSREDIRRKFEEAKTRPARSSDPSRRLANIPVMGSPADSTDECVFCEIVAGRLPSAKVAEDETTLAFMDSGCGHVAT